jgi:hypothetical protein
VLDVDDANLNVYEDLPTEFYAREHQVAILQARRAVLVDVVVLAMMAGFGVFTYFAERNVLSGYRHRTGSSFWAFGVVAFGVTRTIHDVR